MRSKVKSAVTDVGDTPFAEMSPGVYNLLGILRACGATDAAASFMADYETGGLRRYAPLKEAVADALVQLTGNLRTKRADIAADRDNVKRLMYDGSQKASGIARETLAEVRKLVGLPKH